MTVSEKAECFKRLKDEVRIKVAESLNINKDLKDWSVNDIRDFQDDLLLKCKGSVSEKWVYLHLKKEGKTLPRVDVLNLLSNYCGYESWDSFCATQSPKMQKRKTYKVFWVALVVVLILTAYWIFPKKTVRVLIVKDAYTNEIIDPAVLKFKMNTEYLKASVRKNDVLIRVVQNDSLEINGNYYKPLQTFINTEQTADTLAIRLYPDDYALMLNYFSRTTIDDWQHRQEQLNEVIHEDARIFQVHPKFDGIEMLNKTEFINRLTLPLNSLQNLEILNIEYKDNQIYRLRFLQNIE